MEEQDAFKFFKKNINDAKRTLKLLRLEELWGDIQSIRPLSQIRLMPIRRMLKERSERIYELVLPQIIVFGVSSLDAFLKEKYKQKKGKEYGKGNRAFQKADTIRKALGKCIKGDIFAGDENLKEDLQKVFDKRHVIAHRAGRIDDKYYDKYCKGKGFDVSWVRKKLPLKSKEVENDLAIIEKFGEIANAKLR